MKREQLFVQVKHFIDEKVLNPSQMSYTDIQIFQQTEDNQDIIILIPGKHTKSGKEEMFHTYAPWEFEP